jgi:hypothetical protein
MRGLFELPAVHAAQHSAQTRAVFAHELITVLTRYCKLSNNYLPVSLSLLTAQYKH